jgi:hypothetical protein
MARIIAKLALYGLGLLAIFNVTRHRRRERDRNAGNEALATWEHEGGSVPATPGRDSARGQPSTV